MAIWDSLSGLNLARRANGTVIVVINAILMYVWGNDRGVVHTGRSSRNYRVELVPVQALGISSEQLSCRAQQVA